MLNPFFAYRWMFVLVLALLVSCTSTEQENHEVVTPEYVSTTSTTVPVGAYPASPVSLSPSVEAYPLVETVNENRILLALDKPMSSGDTMVTGVGPPGLYVYILNITLMGEELGSGAVDNDGIFTISLSELLVDTRIGLSADIGTIGLTEVDVLPGEDTVSVPQVGYFYDSYIIRE